MLTNTITDGVKERLLYTLGKRPESASAHDIYMALCYAVRDRMIDNHLVENHTERKLHICLQSSLLDHS